MESSTSIVFSTEGSEFAFSKLTLCRSWWASSGGRVEWKHPWRSRPSWEHFCTMRKTVGNHQQNRQTRQKKQRRYKYPSYLHPTADSVLASYLKNRTAIRNYPQDNFTELLYFSDHSVNKSTHPSCYFAAWRKGFDRTRTPCGFHIPSPRLHSNNSLSPSSAPLDGPRTKYHTTIQVGTSTEWTLPDRLPPVQYVNASHTL